MVLVAEQSCYYLSEAAMTKYLIGCVAPLVLLLSVCGCTPAAPEPGEAEEAVTAKVELPTFEPNDVEPVETEPVQAELPAPEPNDLEATKAAPLEALPAVAESNDVEPGKAEPVRTESVVVEPNQVERPIPEANEIEPAGVEPAEAEPAEDTQPATEPNDVASVEPGPEMGAPNEPEVAGPNEPEMTEPNELEIVQTEPNKVEPNEPGPAMRVSFHDKCAEIFKNFVDENGMVDYRRLKLRRSSLRRLLSEFDRLDRNEYNSWPKDDKIAFWVNAYNAKILDIIVRNYPIKSSRWMRFMYPPTSIRHIPPVGTIGASKWNRYKFIVMDEEFTLAVVEQQFFRKEFAEPRIFLALSYASLSSPPLRTEPYYGDKLDEQLSDQVRRFLSGPRAFRIDRDAQKVYLSALFEATWHGKEFLRKFGTDKKFKDKPPAIRAILNFISNYIGERDASFLEVGNYSVEFMKYDWRLNDSPSR